MFTKIRKKHIFYLVIALIVIWHAIWFANYYSYRYYPNGYTEYYDYLTKSTKDHEYSYNIKYPNYPSFVGNYTLDNNNLIIIIWPGLFTNGNREYGIYVFDSDLNQTFEFYVDSSLNYSYEKNNILSDDENKIQNLLAKYKPEIENMEQLIYDEWGK